MCCANIQMANYRYSINKKIIKNKDKDKVLITTSQKINFNK
jgi:hypothetical protein